MTGSEVDVLWRALRRLESAQRLQRARKWRLALWSRFVRLRDAQRCVYCESTDGLNAHHIFRRTILRSAELETGNGITLCADCHHGVHATFNGAPRPGEPLNFRGGDDQDYIASLFHALERDGRRRGILLDPFYFLSDDVLSLFKVAQGFPPDMQLDGSRVGQAHLIWQQAPISFYSELGAYLCAVLYGAEELSGEALQSFTAARGVIN